MTPERERMLAENGYFLYQGYHFKPSGQFPKEEGNFFEITKRLKRDTELGMMAENYFGQQKREYSHAGFYAASPTKDADLFLCLENQKVYVPCEYELQEYMREPEKNQKMGRIR